MIEFTSAARRLGIVSSAGVAVLQFCYAVTLVIGFLTLKSPADPMGDPVFTILEVLILAMTPFLLMMMGAVHAWAHPKNRIFSLLSLLFMSLAAGLTCCVHFMILTLSRSPEFASHSWTPLVFAFRWPSVVYALDILAWDFFFALAVLCAAPVFSGNRLATAIRICLLLSGALSLAGLYGAATANMQLRNIGILGYLGVFMPASGLIHILFRRTAPRARPYTA